MRGSGPAGSHTGVEAAAAGGTRDLPFARHETRALLVLGSCRCSSGWPCFLSCRYRSPWWPMSLVICSWRTLSPRVADQSYPSAVETL